MKTIAGKKFGRLTAVRFYDVSKRGDRWLCRCACGKSIPVLVHSLKTWNTTSCGCKRTESLILRNKKSATKDGLSNSPTGRCWGAMLRRCYATTAPEYARHGAIGIKVCEYLRATPLNVILLIGERPPKLSIDRIDNELGYHCGSCSECLEKGRILNVRWATAKQQNRNKRNNRVIELNGEKHCLAEWIEILGISKHAVGHRLYDLGWSVEDALTKPLRITKATKFVPK